MRVALCQLLLAVALTSCEREERSLRLQPPVGAALNDARLMPNGIGGAPPQVLTALGQPYENNAFQLNQGKRLYSWFNCSGCHADGGGAAGPALIDGWWRYGPDPTSIFATIRDGRPNGMPPFGNKLTTEQIWQLTGYIRALGTESASTAAPSRNDDLQTRPAENRAPAAANRTPRADW